MSGENSSLSICIVCAEFDDDNMVQCDNCDQWAHYNCVGVGPEIENFDWCCSLCHVSSTGLSLTDAPRKAVDASVGIEPKSFLSRGTGTDVVFDPVTEDVDLYPTHLKLEDEATYNLYEDTLAKFRGNDVHDTVKVVAQNMISDKVLVKYSYCGQGTKPPFKKFYIVTNVIITATIESMERAYRQKYEKDKTQTQEEQEKLYKDVENYFSKEYVKKAKTRLNQTKN